MAQLDYACQQATGDTRPFGGLRVILAGDLFQLGPVRAGLCLSDAALEVSKSLYVGLLEDYNRLKRYKKDKISIPKPDDDRLRSGHPFHRGAELLTSAKWFHLNEQTRAKDDKQHTQTVERLGNGHSIRLAALEIYKKLSEEDIRQERWLRAPMITATNHERLLMTHHRSLQLAQFLGKKVVRWRSRVEKYNHPTAHEDVDDPAYFEYFLQSADAYLTANIFRKLGLVNALKVKMHSIVPADEEDLELLKKAEDGTLSGPICELSQPPAYINVEIPAESMELLPPATIRYLQTNNLQTADGAVVIPIAPFSGGNKKPVHVFPHDEPLDLKCDAWVLPHFPLEMAFAITVNKAEGQTFKEGVIVAISARANYNFSHAGFYVALSRVEDREDMRFLVSGMSEEQEREGLQYIEQLHPLPSIKALFDGFGGDWSPHNWQTKRYRSVNAVTSLARES